MRARHQGRGRGAACRILHIRKSDLDRGLGTVVLRQRQITIPRASKKMVQRQYEGIPASQKCRALVDFLGLCNRPPHYSTVPHSLCRQRHRRCKLWNQPTNPANPSPLSRFECASTPNGRAKNLANPPSHGGGPRTGRRRHNESGPCHDIHIRAGNQLLAHHRTHANTIAQGGEIATNPHPHAATPLRTRPNSPLLIADSNGLRALRLTLFLTNR